MKNGLIFTLLGFLSVLFLSCEDGEEANKVVLKINQLQVLGSHNSYKKAIYPPLLQMIQNEDSILALELDYEHAPLVDQLDLGLRQVELDLFFDPQGGRYAKPLGLELLKKAGKQAPLFAQRMLLEAPGFKVFHIQEFDFQSHCPVFLDCLSSLLQWSKNHQDHLPILVTINPKVRGISRAGLSLTQPLPFTKNALDSLDEEILAIIPKEKIISPDLVRGRYSSLEEAVKAGNWPAVKDARGKFLFAIDAAPQGEIISSYLDGHPSLEGRVMFVNSLPGQAHAAFMVMNNPLKSQEQIQKRVKEGYLIRTRADAGTYEARNGDFSRFQAAKTSGAQFISTDYYIPDHRFPHNYIVKWDSGWVGRCNPMFPELNCDNSKLELN